MQKTLSNSDEELPGRSYAEPLAGLRVSWGSVLAGAVTMLAVSLLLWALALAIVSIAAHAATIHAFKASAIALWICAMATTLAGALAGGWISGYLPGNRHVLIGVAHGFLAWCVALLLAFGFQASVFRTIVTTATDVANAAIAGSPGLLSSTASTAGTERRVVPSPRAQQSLVSLGYSHEEASRMIRTEEAREARGTAEPARYDAKVLVDYAIGAGWSWFGTWFVAALLAVGGAAMGARSLWRTRARREGPEPYPGARAPMTPAPTS